MKNKGVMISLAAIVLIGMMITTGTHNFIEKNSTGGDKAAPQVTAAAMAMDEAAGEEDVGEPLALGEEPLMAGMAEGAEADEEEPLFGDAPMERQAQRQFKADAGLLGTYAEEEDFNREDDLPMEEPALTADTGKSEAVISPAPGPDTDLGELKENVTADMLPAETQSYYIKRLQDLDSQIQKNKEGQTTGANVNSSVKSAASGELKLWDSELNDIYNTLLERLDQEESEELVKEERTWLKERDSLAMDAAKKSSGGSSESIEYTISLTESTRQRAYELAQRYAQVLED